MVRWGGAREVRRAANGPLDTNTPAAWKGMGPSGCHSSPALFYYHPYPLRPTSFLLLLLFVCTLAWASVTGLRNPQCPIDLCWEHYQSAKDALELTGVPGDFEESNSDVAGGRVGVGDTSASLSGAPGGGGMLESEAHCVALRTYWNCIRGTKNTSRGCQGDIRYHSIRNGVKNQMKQYNCTQNGPTLDPTRQTPQSDQIPYECRFHGKKVFRHCGLFGDPHLRTFTNEFQTCKVRGAWPLIDNDYLTVQVTNDPVLGGSTDATATSKLTVIVKDYRECGSDQFHTYQAQTDLLPSAFENGYSSSGPHSSLELVEVEANKHVEIRIHYIATTIIVRQIGRYFTFAIRMPEQLVNNSHNRADLELCSKGCPPNERINYQEYLAQRRHSAAQIPNSIGSEGPILSVTRQEAEARCKDAGLVDFYFDSCVFDLMATGDMNFTVAAIMALKDTLDLDNAMTVTHSNRSDLDEIDRKYGSAASSRTQLSRRHLMVCVLVTYFFNIFTLQR